MIIDCHGHYTTEPQKLHDFRKGQIAAIKDPTQKPSASALKISDDELRESVEGAQLKFQRERGTSLTIFSPRASGMSHHIGDEGVSLEWSQVSNELIYRLTTLYPDNFIGVCQLPQSPGVNPKNCIGELERCINEFGFVGCNLNPDPSGGRWDAPPVSDRFWYPLYEKMVELDVPAMIHVSASCNPATVHTTGAHYINGDTTAFMQLIASDLFKDFPTLKFIIPHGGGAVPYHWGRYRFWVLFSALAIGLLIACSSDDSSPPGRQRCRDREHGRLDDEGLSESRSRAPLSGREPRKPR